ncbi:PaaI family thioesterase [Jeotgalibacillus proteolyticus]|uniref:PaaI family thioesterase n=1 Tax=Jeotgalibacillus proteolyticus TaxID=2082395 RepID=A0A2S5GGX7_9BACL|nr:PaaI family thioesterase [Jeotgalibacillus proteolyticus]PPA72165.1 PaaI family thioesterase [Jeotgalibacillus proteolyticus]
MKDELRLLTEELLAQGSEDDLNVLHHILLGLKGKNEGYYSSYVGAILNMKKEITPSSCSVKVPITKALNNSLDIVHGGMTATILDTAMGTLANLLAPEGYGAVTSQLTIHYLLPVQGEEMAAEAHIIHQGNKTMVIEGVIFSPEGKRLAHATGTFYLLTLP